MQSDLAYDPQQYQRDRGDADWDARSMASTNILGGGGGSFYQPAQGPYQHAQYAQSQASQAPAYAQSQYFDQPPPPAPAPGRFERYMPGGGRAASPRNDIELASLDQQQQPLLREQQGAGGYEPHRRATQYSDAPALPASMHQGPLREAPVHRPARQASGYAEPSPAYHSPDPSWTSGQGSPAVHGYPPRGY